MDQPGIWTHTFLLQVNTQPMESLTASMLAIIIFCNLSQIVSFNAYKLRLDKRFPIAIIGHFNIIRNILSWHYYTKILQQQYFLFFSGFSPYLTNFCRMDFFILWMKKKEILCMMHYFIGDTSLSLSLVLF